MLGQDADKALDRTKDHAVDHDGPVLLTVLAHVLQFKTLRQLEIELDGRALPGTAEAVHQMEVDLRAVESAVAFVDTEGKLQRVQCVTKAVLRGRPFLIRAHGILGPGGKLHAVGEAKELVHAVDDLDDIPDFVLDLVLGDVGMGIILGKAAHPHKAVQLAGLFVPVHDAGLREPERQVSVGTGLALVDQDAARAVHRLDGELAVLGGQREHIIMIMLPVAGSLPKHPVQDNGGGDLHVAGFAVHFAPVVHQGIL